MPCFHPITAYQVKPGRPLLFKVPAGLAKIMAVPCGMCHGCRLERSRQWAVRCVHEASLYHENCFITLTYDSKIKDPGFSLDYRDFQLFMKRLRKRFPNNRIRFFMCGEYGEIGSRPHFHACLFGFNFPDRQVFRSLPGGCSLSSSVLLSELWSFGFATIGEVTFESAAYVARYVMKKELGPDAGKVRRIVDVTTGLYLERCHEFCKMSLRPGIAKGWITRFQSDVYPHGRCVSRGFEAVPPRFYDLQFKAVDPVGHAGMLLRRSVSRDAVFDDNSPDRLRVKEVVSKSRLALKRRSL